MEPVGVVAAGHPATARAGYAMLAAGGNAFDAAIAAFFMACVAEPVLASPGGGGFLLSVPATGAPCVYDGFAQTPRPPCGRADGSSFYPVVAEFGTTTQEFHIGPGSVATPGIIPCLGAVHRAHGCLPWADLLQPAIAAARDGLEVDAFSAHLLAVVRAIFTDQPDTGALFGSKVKPGMMLQSGETAPFPELAEIFATLATEGPTLFTTGAVAGAIVDLCAARGGHLTKADLAGYKVIRREPRRFGYRGAELLTNPLPSLGGSLVALGVEVLATAGDPPTDPQSPAAVDRLARLLGLLNAAKRHEARPEGIPGEAWEAFRAALARHPVSRQGTTHISVLDAVGNAAGLTVSNGSGSGILVPGCGFALNNMLGEEDLNPHGFFTFAPDTRMASMMAPTAVRYADGSLEVVGSGGSNRIRVAILQYLLRRLEDGLSAAAAVAAPRLCFEHDVLHLEGGFPPTTAGALQAVYPAVQLWPGRDLFFGGTHVARREARGGFSGVGDARRNGAVCGG